MTEETIEEETGLLYPNILTEGHDDLRAVLERVAHDLSRATIGVEDYNLNETREVDMNLRTGEAVGNRRRVSFNIQYEVRK